MATAVRLEQLSKHCRHTQLPSHLPSRLPSVSEAVSEAVSKAMSEARQRYCSGIIPFQLICIVLGLTLALLAGCDRDTTLVEPPDFFDFDPDNAWPQCNVPPEPAPVQGSPPQPAGIRIEACPNPAPPGTQKITFRFSLSINARANLGILDDRGRLIRKLLVDTNLSAGTNPEFTWNIIDVPPGDYRAYFRTGKEESQGDLRIE